MSDADPVAGDKCKAGECIDSASGAQCKEDPCKCKEKKDVCGSTFPAECKRDPDTVYTCSGKDAEPVAGDKCKPGECLSGSPNDNCKPPPPPDCNCRDDTDICGSQYDDSCKLDKDTLYKCTGGNGTKPVEGDKCKAGECEVNPTGSDKCKEDPCKCKDKIDVCGSTFPAECKRDPDTVYTCSAKDADPVAGDKCKTGECIDSASGAQCKEDPCKCKDKIDVCGSTFPAECKRDPDTVYTCSAKDAEPVAGDKCNAGECTDAPTGAKCDPCKCKGTTQVCGSTFDDSCKFEKTALFSCNATGAAPTQLTNCTLGCELTSPDNKCKDCETQVKNATNALESVTQLLETAIKTGGSTAVVAAVLAKNVEKLKLDLPLAAADAVGLGAIAGPGKQLVGFASDLLDKLANGTGDATTTLLISTLRTLVPTLGAVEECAGGNTTDCDSIVQLYKDIKSTALDTIKVIPGSSVIIDFINNATGTIDTALETGSGALVGQALGVLDGAIGTITALPLLGTALAPITALYEAAKAAIKCQIGIDPEGDKCLIFNKRFEGALQALIDLVKDNLDKIPIFGEHISTPLLNTLKEALSDVQKGGAGAIGTTVGTIKGLLQILDLAGGNTGNDLANPITQALLGILGLADGAGDCAQGGDPCSGVIKLAKGLIESAADTIGELIPGASFATNLLIKGFLDPLASALNNVSATAINAVVGTLKTAAGLLKAVAPQVGPALDTLIGGLEMVAKCLTTGGDVGAKTTIPTVIPTTIPTVIPTTIPTVIPTTVPTVIPTTVPTVIPTIKPPGI
ncbi:hypothetical protein EC991_005960 [Linnemannia zychae]|nr:hypothetical protein EC991_005960 [Linnemannia zychae]